MKRHGPILLIAAGLCLLVGGFVYDVIFGGIPYQDPAPEMSARYALHSRVASIIRLSGFAAMVVGGVAGVARLAAGRRTAAT
jgi:hypothetical protein